MSDLLNQASLVMVPSGYKEDTVYSVVPSDGSGDLSFTRASNGTRINSAGLVEVTPWNLLNDSEAFNAGWTKQQSTVTANAITAPNGTTTADFLVPNTNNDLHSIFQTSGITSGKYTISVYAKQGGYKNLLVWFDGHSGGIGVNLDNLTIFRNQNNDGYLIETLENGWYRISVTSTISTASLPNFYIYDNSSTPQISFAGNGTSGVYLWGAQMNDGALKPYFPTTDRLNVPRLTYQNGGGGCPSLLLEKQSTNYIDFSNTSNWGVSSTITKTQNTTDLLSPDGTNNATKIVSTAGTGDTSVAFSIPDGTVTLSFYGRVASGTKTLVVDVRNNSGTVSSSSPTLTTEWQRFTLTNSTSGTGSSGAVWIYPNGAGTFYIYGVQAESSSYATSLILTTGASATRVADACSKTGISSLIGQTSGVLFADLVFLNPEPMFFLSIVGTDWFQDSIYFELANSTNYISVASVKSSTGVGSANSTIAPTANSRYKIAVQYSGTAFNLYINGTKISGTRSANALCSKLYLNELGTLSSTKNNLQTKFNEVVTFTTALSDAECIALTTI
jgi:hypothetical protein